MEGKCQSPCRSLGGPIQHATLSLTSFLVIFSFFCTSLLGLSVVPWTGPKCSHHRTLLLEFLSLRQPHNPSSQLFWVFTHSIFPMRFFLDSLLKIVPPFPTSLKLYLPNLPIILIKCMNSSPQVTTFWKKKAIIYIVSKHLLNAYHVLCTMLGSR